jgi:hypothetical protein
LSARMISPTFLNCSALARELPPNFTTFFIFFPPTVYYFKLDA